MENILLKQKIENFLKENKVEYRISEEKKEGLIFIKLFTNYSLEGETDSIKLDVYRNYILLNMFGWEVIEKLNINEGIKTLKSLEILDLFLHKELKIKIIYYGTKPCTWKVYLLRDNRWELFKQTRKFFRNPLAVKVSKEINIEDLQMKESINNLKT